MSSPAMLSPLPTAAVAGNAPAAGPATTRDASAPFGQQLLAARNAQPVPAPASAKSDPPPASAGKATGTARTDAAPSKPAHPAEETKVSNVATPAAKTAPAAADPATANAPGIAPAPPGDGSLLDTAMAAAQAAAAAQASASAGSADGKTPPATSPKADAGDAPPDDTGAAALAGAMLAMLGQVNGLPAPVPTAGKGLALDPDGARAQAASLSPLSLADVLGSGAKAVSDNPLAANASAPATSGATHSPATPFAALLTATGAAATAAVAGDAHQDNTLEALALAAPALPPTTPAAPPLPPLQIATPPGQPGFANELGQQVIWLGRQDIQSARIHLHPEDLGSIDVHLNVSHDRVDVVFAAQHPAAVTAVQQSLPQLQQMLAQHGLALGHAEVGQQQQGNPHSHGTHHGAAAPDEPGGIAAIASLPAAASQIGLLDAFA
ncbi:MAG: flagellar hook-length control protein FliK [Rhodanobacter sp.]|nr:MAG: flagellar hook-length control protein FliK [Rhodanobacter sp.]TAM37107.1 MAG: flagellar hook-length control protein FliK [Rhodanobacter sp.]